MKSEAYYMWGRWKVNCQTCGTSNLITPGQDSFICLQCYPGQRATAFVGKPSDPKQFIQVPDLEAREVERKKAIKEKAQHEVIYRIDHKKIEQILRNRPEPNRNWFPHESLDDLRRENKEHGVRS